MNITRTLKFPTLLLVSALTGLVMMQPALAQRGDRDQDQNPRYEKNDRSRTPSQDRNQRKVAPRYEKTETQRYEKTETRRYKTIERDRLPDRTVRTPSRAVPPPRGYVLDRKYNHDHYYPPRGYVTPRLPDAYRVLVYRDTRYYYHSGVWYRRSPTGFIVVFPPIGVAIPILPPFYTIIWVGSVPYYYANGIYYVWYPAQQAYVVTNPPPESAISDEPAEPEKLFIYPKQGQSERQQDQDRYQCHQWAMEKSGYDPTRAGGNVPEAEYFNKRSDYQRAMKACLEARGYSVK